jgi:hypothetical protein
MYTNRAATFGLLIRPSLVAMLGLLSIVWVEAEPRNEIIGTWRAERVLLSTRVFSGDQPYTPQKVEPWLILRKDGTFTCKTSDPAFFNQTGKYFIKELGEQKFYLLLEVKNDEQKEIVELLCFLDNRYLWVKVLNKPEDKRPSDFPKDIDDYIRMGQPEVMIFRRVPGEGAKQ